MGKSFRRQSDRNYRDDYEIYSKNEQDYRRHKDEKRIGAALRSKNVRALYEDEEDDEY